MYADKTNSLPTKTNLQRGKKRKVSFSETPPSIHETYPSEYFRRKKVNHPENLKKEAYDRRSCNAKRQYKINKHKILEKIRLTNSKYYYEMLRQSHENYQQLRKKNREAIDNYYKILRQEMEISSDSESDSESDCETDSLFKIDM